MPRPEKREAILDAATRVFLKQGYGGASIDAIAAASKVSKPTVYNHFAGKAALFAAVKGRLLEVMMRSLQSLQLESLPPRQALLTVGRHLLSVMLQKRHLQLFRILVGEAGRHPELGRTYYESAMRSGQRSLAELLTLHARAGSLRIADPELAARQLLDLLKGDLHLRLLIGVTDKVDAREIEQHVGQAVELFMAAYGPR